jgi:hypothetical protein
MNERRLRQEAGKEEERRCKLADEQLVRRPTDFV